MAFAVAAPAAAACDDDERPGAPHSLKATSLGSGGIMLQWSRTASYYDIHIRDKQGRPVPEAPDIAGGAHNLNYLEFHNLKPDKEYFFTIRARTEGGTQGCVSRNASETVSARTDRADLDAACSNYAKAAMEDVQRMSRKQCQFPGGSISGIWAANERTHFLFCIEQKRARKNGDSEAQWSRNQDLQACEKQAAKCNAYKRNAASAAIRNKILGCGNTGERWALSRSTHYTFCMGVTTAKLHWEARARNTALRICKDEKAKAAQGGGNSGGGSGPPPAEWSEMLQVHNDMRGQFCAPPLTWSAELAKGAQEYADKCNLGTHGNPPGIGENLAVRERIPVVYPASSDAVAFQDTWGCEKDLYDFTNPEIVGGFKNDCLSRAAGGEGVNGHFTQVVWRSTTHLGCGRARCVMKDDTGVEHTLTNWVCRYSPGGNDTSALAQNVKKPPCGEAFRSLSGSACSGGRVKTEFGVCVCPPGSRWDGLMCTSRGGNPSTPPQSQLQPETGGGGGIIPGGTPSRERPPVINIGPGGGTQGSRPGDAPARERPPVINIGPGTGGTQGSRPGDAPPRERPPVISTGPGTGGTQGTRPGDAPSRERPPVISSGPGTGGTQGSKSGDAPPRDRPPVINTGKPDGGTQGTKPGADDRPRCPPGTIGRFPRCQCPLGMTGSPPNCCPPGTRSQNGTCVSPQPQRKCPDGRIGTPPNCTCPPGTHATRSGQCIANAGPTQQRPPPPSKAEPDRQCTGGRIGRPPRCRCPAGTRFLGGLCRSTAKPTPTGPTPKRTCSGGKVPRSTDGVCVCPNGTTNRGGQCVGSVR